MPRPFLLALLALAACTTDSAATTEAEAVAPPASPTPPAGLVYPWLAAPGPPAATVAARFPVPAGCQRVAVAAGSWGEWLRWLPLLPAGTPARLYDGTLKNRQDVVAAVVNIDVGRQDLQQCADAVIRLRAEYLFAHDPAEVHFRLTTGYDFRFSDYVGGQTFAVRGEKVVPAPKAAEAPTHAALARYLLPTFGYAGTLSLSRELRAVPLAQVQPGDVLIRGGSPGHAVLVLDVAENRASGARYMLLAQSYMPAQSIHVLRDEVSGTWFRADEYGNVSTPEWGFRGDELKRF